MNWIFQTFAFAIFLPLTLFAQDQVYTSISQALANKEEAKVLHIPANTSVTVADWRKIAQLQQLRELRIQSDRMVFIPDLIGRLDSLRILEVSTKQDVKWPNEAMAELQSLKMLKLKDCLGESIPPFIVTLKGLEHLEISDKTTQNAPQGLNQLAGLKHLVLDLPSMTEWPADLGELNALSELHLVSGVLLEIPTRGFSWENLRILDLNLAEVEYLPTEMLSPKLVELRLNCPKLLKWPESVSQLVSLRTLFLHGGFQTALLPDMADLTSLERLTFFDLRLPAAKFGLEKCSNLNEVQFFKCDVEGFKWKALRGKSLELLQISHCSNAEYKQLNGKMAIQSLVIQDDQLTGVPPKVNQVNHLETLDLSGQRLVHTGKIWQSESLKSLTIARTEALTTLPALEVSWGQTLEEVHIWTYEKASLPESFGQLKNLRRLTLRAVHWNRLPESLGNLTQLENLVLEGIDKESLPNSLNNLTQLKNVLLYVSPNVDEVQREQLEAFFPGARVAFRNSTIH